MGLDQVVEEVLEQGRKEAEGIGQEAEQEAEAILDDARDQAGSIREERIKEAEDTAESEKRRILASAELAAKKERLDAEADVLASVRSRVKKRLADLPQKERASFLRSLIEESGADAFEEGAKAWAPEEDRDIVEGYGFDYEGPVDALGGAIVENKDGSIREDLTFDTLLDQVWRDQMHHVAMNVLEP